MAEQTFELYTGSATGTQIDNAAAKVAAMEETLSGTAATIPSSAAVKNYVDAKTVETESTLSGNAVYDISEANNGTTYANLAAALNNGNNIPASIRKGGISIKFIQSSDNKYVQYRYMSSSTAVANFTNVANWQGVDDEPTAGSDNLVKSGGVYNTTANLEQKLVYFQANLYDFSDVWIDNRKYINSNGEVISSNIGIGILEVDVSEEDTYFVTNANTAGACIAFYNTDGYIAGSAFAKNDNVYREYEIPSGCTLIKLSNKFRDTNPQPRLYLPSIKAAKNTDLENLRESTTKDRELLNETSNNTYALNNVIKSNQVLKPFFETLVSGSNAAYYWAQLFNNDNSFSIGKIQIRVSGPSSNNKLISVSVKESEPSTLIVTDVLDIADLIEGVNDVELARPMRIEKNGGLILNVHDLLRFGNYSGCDMAYLGASFNSEDLYTGKEIAFSRKLSNKLLSLNPYYIEIGQENYQLNYLYNKKILALGDSMTAYSGSWIDKMGDRNHMNYINGGISGSLMSLSSGREDSVYDRLCNELSPNYIGDEIIKAQDYIIIYSGTNDCSLNKTIGDINSVNPEEFNGAINLICQALQTRNPLARIGFITVQLRSGIESKCQDYIDACQSVCNKYSIPVFDQGKNCGICWSNSALVEALTMKDNTHLNPAGKEWISYKYESFVRQL